MSKELPEDRGPWRCLSRREMYRNPWISVRHEEVLTPAGTPGIYGVVHFRSHAVGIVPLDDDDCTWLVGQYRYTLNRYCWEIPMGGAPEGGSLLDTARRELAEETGLRAAHWREILSVDLSKSVTDETGAVFVATGLTPGDMAPEPTEDISVRRLPFHEALDMALNGEITDVLSIAALLKVDYLRRHGRL